jgi:ribosomal protein S18 acetylase RimI-like enzyme
VHTWHAWGTRGPEFKSRRPDQQKAPIHGAFGVLAFSVETTIGRKCQRRVSGRRLVEVVGRDGAEADSISGAARASYVESYIVSVPPVAADVLIRDAVEADADAISVIGKMAMPAQYAGLVDSAATEAAVEQSYAPSAVAECITRCHESPDALFVVAERAGRVIGYLHFDSFGPEPELHRLYVDDSERGGGVGTLLMDLLHARINDSDYMLLVVEGNEGAVRFYERSGLHVEAFVDGLAYYAERMGVRFPPGTQPFRLVLMRRPAQEEPSP